MTHGWPDATTRDLQARLIDWMDTVPAGFERDALELTDCYGLSPTAGRALQQQFEQFCLELFAYQFERIPVYGDWCRQSGHVPATVHSAEAIPALPVEAFRGDGVHSFPAAAAVAHFRTSGTTATRTGTLLLDDLTLYERSLLRSFKHHVLPDCSRIRMLQLIPTASAAPSSSLAHMVDCVRAHWGTAHSDCFVAGDQLRIDALQEALARSHAAQEPVLLLGTAFAWVAFLDACNASGWRLQLPPGSRLFETGGYKGKVRELTRPELLQSIEACLGIPASHVVSEYGMTEMGSQYYTLSLRAALLHQPVRDTVPETPAWSFPFWLRPRLLRSEEALPSALPSAGGIGLLLHHDLANRGSVSHLLTADLGESIGASFALVGRAPIADLRGCGLAQESLHASRST
jgi:hypothetical protein